MLLFISTVFRKHQCCINKTDFETIFTKSYIGFKNNIRSYSSQISPVVLLFLMSFQLLILSRLMSKCHQVSRTLRSLLPWKQSLHLSGCKQLRHLEFPKNTCLPYLILLKFLTHNFKKTNNNINTYLLPLNKHDY